LDGREGNARENPLSKKRHKNQHQQHPPEHHQEPPRDESGGVRHIYAVKIEPTADQQEKYAEQKLYWKRQLSIACWLNAITAFAAIVGLGGLIFLFGTLRATKQAADAATKGADLTQREQRPYMIAEAPRFIDPPSVEKKAKATDFIRNVGKTPAIKVFSSAQFVRYIDSSKSRPQIFAFLDSAFTEIKAKHLSSRQEPNVRKDVPPNAAPLFRTDEDSAPLSQPEILQIEKGDLVLFYIGIASYSDSFGGEFETEYCFFYIGPDPKVWHVCDSHNTIK
jgi:hypothetical protein